VKQNVIKSHLQTPSFIEVGIFKHLDGVHETPFFLLANMWMMFDPHKPHQKELIGPQG
jgi:hypothetical protein